MLSGLFGCVREECVGPCRQNGDVKLLLYEVINDSCVDAGIELQ